jgi:hypothetical protein
MSNDTMNHVYFDADGCWGCAHERYFVVLDTTDWTDEDFDAVASCYDSDRMGLAIKINNKYKKGEA